MLGLKSGKDIIKTSESLDLTPGSAVGVTGEREAGAGGQVQDGVRGAGELGQEDLIRPHTLIVVPGAALARQLVKRST